MDLAGSERQKGTGATGIRLREAGGINKSLSALGTYINALSTRENSPKSPATRKHHAQARTPSCRDSKLTFLLKDALGGNAKLCLIAAISPALSSIEETMSTLEFAKRCASVRNRAVVNERLTEDVSALQQEVRRLQQLLRKTQKSPSDAKISKSDLYQKSSTGSESNCSSPVGNNDLRISAVTQTDTCDDSLMTTTECGAPQSSAEKSNMEKVVDDNKKAGEKDNDEKLRAVSEQANEILLLKKKWGEMIEMNQRLWTMLIEREAEVLRLKENALERLPSAIIGKMRNELQVLRDRVHYNPETLILRHRLEAIESGILGKREDGKKLAKASHEKGKENAIESTSDRKGGCGLLPKKLNLIGSLSSKTMLLRTASSGSGKVKKSVSFADEIDSDGAISASSSWKRSSHMNRRREEKIEGKESLKSPAHLSRRREPQRQQRNHIESRRRRFMQD